MEKWGQKRLKLATTLRDNVFPKMPELKWIVENGTLLGAHRNKKFIPWDDDFDIAFFVEKQDYSVEMLTRSRCLKRCVIAIFPRFKVNSIWPNTKTWIFHNILFWQFSRREHGNSLLRPCIQAVTSFFVAVFSNLGPA